MLGASFTVLSRVVTACARDAVALGSKGSGGPGVKGSENVVLILSSSLHTTDLHVNAATVSWSSVHRWLYTGVLCFRNKNTERSLAKASLVLRAEGGLGLLSSTRIFHVSVMLHQRWVPALCAGDCAQGHLNRSSRGGDNLGSSSSGSLMSSWRGPCGSFRPALCCLFVCR